MTTHYRKKSRHKKPLHDTQLLVILTATLLTGVGLWSELPRGFANGVTANPLLLLNMLLLYPVVEELLFRGVMQRALLKRPSLAASHVGVSAANWLTSLLFVGLHCFNHSFIWALAVLLPSLTLGHIYERYQRLSPPILLHIAFNATYLVAGSL